MNNEELTGLIAEWYSTREPKAPFVPGETYIPPSGKRFGVEEMKMGILAVLEGWWTEGRWTDHFEEALSRYLGLRYTSFCNSGSSANLLALAALMSPLMGDKRLMPGDEVITTAAGFPTTINPIIQLGLVPVFVDSRLGSYTPEVGDIEQAIGPKTKAIMIAHTLGNPWPINQFEDRDLWLIEDNCDALGSMLSGRFTGTWGHVATQSFYPAHHITTGEGGAVVTDDPKIHKAVESLRDWGRDCWCPPGKENTCGKRFDYEWERLPDGYDHKYVYSHLGYNLKSTDLNAAIGLAQIQKLGIFRVQRIENFKYMWLRMNREQLTKYFVPPLPNEDTMPNWFGFPLASQRWMDADGPIIDREELMKFLAEKKIGSRLLFAGNYLDQPVFQDLIETGRLKEHRVVGDLPGTRAIVQSAFWIGLWPGITKEMMDYMIDSLWEFCDEKGLESRFKKDHESR